jgi:hypothetical protein
MLEEILILIGKIISKNYYYFFFIKLKLRFINKVVNQHKILIVGKNLNSHSFFPNKICTEVW